MKRRRQRGQAMTEYVILVAMLAAMLFVPAWPRPDGGGSVSIFMWFIEAFDIYINSFHTVITMPIP